MHPHYNWLPDPTQYNGPSPQQVMPPYNFPGSSSSLYPNSPQVHPQMGRTNPHFASPYKNSSNQFFTHNSTYLAPNFNQNFSSPNGKFGLHSAMQNTNQFSQMQRPNYAHYGRVNYMARNEFNSPEPNLAPNFSSPRQLGLQTPMQNRDHFIERQRPNYFQFEQHRLMGPTMEVNAYKQSCNTSWQQHGNPYPQFGFGSVPPQKTRNFSPVFARSQMGSVPAQQAHNFSPVFAKPRVGRSVQPQQARNSHRVSQCEQKPEKMTVKVDPTLGRSAENFRTSAIIVKKKCTQLLEAVNRENQLSKLTKGKKKKLKRIQMMQEKESKTPNAAVNSVEVDSTKDAGSINISETESVEKTENLVLRKLLRGPRYFNSSGSSWLTCNKCGDDDHKTADCNMKRREKPCYICGGFEHNPKHCKQERNDSLNNNNIGQLAKGCLEKDLMNVKDDKLCLRCGNSGHEMFSCSNDYSPDDLKVISCYICNKLGHLCCAEYTNERSGRVSCYKCGRSGHLGPVCPKRGKRKRGYHNAAICQTC